MESVKTETLAANFAMHFRVKYAHLQLLQFSFWLCFFCSNCTSLAGENDKRVFLGIFSAAGRLYNLLHLLLTLVYFHLQKIAAVKKCLALHSLAVELWKNLYFILFFSLILSIFLFIITKMNSSHCYYWFFSRNKCI